MANLSFSYLPEKLKDLRQNLLQMSRDDVPGLLAVRTYAQNFVDTLRRAFIQEAKPADGWALVAVGGFGRGELSFASDLDLLFLYHRRLPPIFQREIRDLIYGLWDAGFEVGHVTASISGISRLVQEDFSALTNYLESQFIAGDEALYMEWRKSFLEGFGAQRRRKFFNKLTAYREARLRQYGESSYLLEPQVKEGVGGLRDLHVMRWAGIVFLDTTSFSNMIVQNCITTEEELWLEQAHDFLWRVRLQLHQLTGRRQDQLLFPEQEQVAARLGFLDSSQGPAVEAFMRLYYRHTARIRRTASFFLDRLDEVQMARSGKVRRKKVLPGPFLLEGKHLHFMEPEWIEKDPRLLMRFFWQAACSEAHFHHQTGQIIREHLKAFTEEARTDRNLVKQFFEILMHPTQSFPVLKVMLETGFLDTFIPEYAAIRYRAQHDVYHLYTVDEHLLRTVRELHRMERQTDENLLPPNVSDIFVQLENRHILYLAALLHDIGKGQGKNHSVKGAYMVRKIGQRLGLSALETELLSYLVENHLLLVETALKRDLTDEKPILSCAVQIKDRERLRMLYLLTIADSRATGLGAWNTWKASLLRELFVKVDRLLLYGDWRGEDFEKRCREVQDAVLALAQDSCDRDSITEWLDSLSFRYMLSQAPEAIVKHFEMERCLAREPLVLSAQPAEGEMWQITIATRDRPGLFACITGVLWVFGLNILSADIFTRQSGVALDVLLLERLPDPLHSEQLWEKIRVELIESLKDRSHFERLAADRRKPSLLQRKYLPRKEDRVVINEEASDFYTIIEVYTWDRPGVLHAITGTLFNLGITIQLAKISTPGAQVADVFYVQDLDGNKLLDREVHEKIRQRLLECLVDCA